ncbi:hypothetical protein BH24CHL5_BH24CHL5_12740 [soil metagenome]
MKAIALVLGAALIAGACTSSPPPTAGTTPTSSAAASAPASAQASPSPGEGPSAEPSATAAATGEPLAELVSPGALTACIARVGAPAAELTVEGALDGYNVGFAREIATRLGLTLQVEQPLFEDLIAQLEGHACDVSVSSQNITASRLERITLVPYTKSLQPVLVQIGNPAQVDSLQALCGLAVSATAGTTHVDLVNGNGDYVGEGLNDACQATRREPIDLRTFSTELEAVTALLDGEVAAYLGNPSFVFDYPTRIIYSQATLPAARQGIGLPRDRPGLLAAVEPAIAAMIDDGTYRDILAQYLPNDESVDIVSIIE